MNWTTSYIKSLSIPSGRTKLTLSDPKCSGLYLDVRKSTKVFIFRKTIKSQVYQKRLGSFPELSVIEARNLADDCRRKAELGIWTSHTRERAVTINELFYEHYHPHSRMVHKTTKARVGAYKKHISPFFAKTPVQDITASSIRAWRSSLLKKGLSPSTINKLLVIFGQLIDLAHDLEIKNVQERRKLGLKGLEVANANDFFLTGEQLSKLRNACAKSSNTSLLTIVDLLILTGARKREILDATWNNIDLELRLLRVPLSKNGKPRHITLCQQAVAIFSELKSTRSNSVYILPNPATGEPYQCIFHAWDKARIAAGLPNVRIHDLRHSFASALVNSGVSLYEVQQLLGHASIKTTQRYAHLDQTRLQRSVESVSAFYK